MLAALRIDCRGEAGDELGSDSRNPSMRGWWLLPVVVR